MNPAVAPLPPVDVNAASVTNEATAVEVDSMQVDSASTSSSVEAAASTVPSTSTPVTPQLSPFDESLSKVHRILSRDVSVHLHLDFLFRNNHTDLLILKKTKDSLETRSSVFHQSITVANAFMSCGTTSDEFLKTNLQWLAKASNWTKFIATAGFGVIHKVR